MNYFVFLNLSLPKEGTSIFHLKQNSWNSDVGIDLGRYWLNHFFNTTNYITAIHLSIEI